MATRKIAKPAKDAPLTPEAAAANEFDAAITDQQLKEMEKVAHGFGINRRIMFVVLARSKEQLVAPAVEDDEKMEAPFDMYEAMDAYIDHLKRLTGIAETARARLLVVCSTVALARGAA